MREFGVGLFFVGAFFVCSTVVEMGIITPPPHDEIERAIYWGNGTFQIAFDSAIMIFGISLAAVPKLLKD